MSKLSNHGYIIRKKNYTIDTIKDVRDDLTVKPYVLDDFGNGKEKSFQLYLESPHKLYLPRFYGFKKFGEPETNKLNDASDCYQLLIVFFLKKISSKWKTNFQLPGTIIYTQ